MKINLQAFQNLNTTFFQLYDYNLDLKLELDSFKKLINSLKKFEDWKT